VVWEGDASDQLNQTRDMIWIGCAHVVWVWLTCSCNPKVFWFENTLSYLQEGCNNAVKGVITVRQFLLLRHCMHVELTEVQRASVH